MMPQGIVIIQGIENEQSITGAAKGRNIDQSSYVGVIWFAMAKIFQFYGGARLEQGGDNRNL